MSNSKLKKILSIVASIIILGIAIWSYFNEDNVVSTDEKTSETTQDAGTENNNVDEKNYCFRTEELLNEHYEKHGIEMGFTSAKDYEKAASRVVNNKKALHKIEAEDGDYVYYLEDTNEFVIVSTDGYLRTYFNPARGLDYYNSQ